MTEFLREYVRPDARAESILAAVALELGLQAPTLWRQHSGDDRVRLARRMAATRLRKELGLSYPAIAGALRCRNHTSAMYLVRAGTLPAA